MSDRDSLLAKLLHFKLLQSTVSGVVIRTAVLESCLVQAGMFCAAVAQSFWSCALQCRLGT